MLYLTRRWRAFFIALCASCSFGLVARERSFWIMRRIGSSFCMPITES